MRSTYGMLEHHALERPAAAAVVFKGEETNYQQLYEHVAQFSRGLRELGVGPGSTVGLLCTNRPEWLIAALGALAAGASVAAFNTWSKRWDLDHLLEHSHCDVLISLRRFRTLDYRAILGDMCPELFGEERAASTRYPYLREIVFIGSGGGDGPRTFDDITTLGRASSEHLDADAASSGELILYTSGSTARPKAVRLRQDVALEHGRDAGARMGVQPSDRIWLPVPLFWSYGSANALMVSLSHGCTLVLQEAFDAGQALDIIERERCTVAYTLANITEAVLSAENCSPERLASLERGITIGSPRDVRRAIEGLGAPGICNAYGSTEIYGGCCITPHDWPIRRKCGSQGPPLPKIGLRIRDRVTGEELPAGETGEITVTGQVTEGYLRQPDATTFAFNEHGEYRTGDLGYVDDDGNLHFVGRATDMIKSGGINIAPLELEDFLLSHDGVSEVAVVGVDDLDKGQVAVAFVRARAGADVDEAVLDAYCREHIASFKVPSLIVVTHSELAKTDTGKLARLKIREEAEELWKKELARRGGTPERGEEQVR
jgi:fatty-acyl-CoA synthase